MAMGMGAAPMAAMRISAWRVIAGRSGVPVWQTVTVALARGLFCMRMAARGLPTMLERPQTTTCLPARGWPLRGRSSTTPAGGGGPGRGGRRERELDEDGVEAAVVVEVEDAGDEGVPVDGLGQVEGVGVDAGLLGGVAFGADVGEGG